MSATTESIRKAADALTIQDVYLRSSRLSLAADYDPKVGPEVKSTNLAWGVKRAQIIEVEVIDSREKMNLWKVEFQTRCRLLREAIEEQEIKNERMDEHSLAIIDAVFIAEYRLTDKDVAPAALAEFSKHNVAYHIWPYWREHLHDIVARALLPRVTLPMHVFRPPKETKAETSKSTENK